MSEKMSDGSSGMMSATTHAEQAKSNNNNTEKIRGMPANKVRQSKQVTASSATRGYLIALVQEQDRLRAFGK